MDVFFAVFLVSIPLGTVGVPGVLAFLSPTKLTFLMLLAWICVTAGWKIRKLLRVWDAWLAVLSAMVLASALAAADVAAGLGTWMRLTGMAALFVVARAYLGSRNGAHMTTIVLALIAGACAVLGIYQTMTSQTLFGLGIYGPYQSLVPVESLRDLETALVYRAAGPFRHPNEFGLFMVGAQAFTFAWLERTGSWKSRILAVALSGTQVIALLYAYSRSAWLGGLVVIAWFLVFSQQRRLIALSVIAGLILGMALLPPAAREAVTQRSGRVQPYDSERVESWQAAVNMVLKRPLLGVGPGSFAEHFEEFKRPEARLDERQRHDAHNAFLSIAAEAGLPAGLAMGFGVVFSAAFGISRMRGKNRAARVGTAALLGMLPIMMLNSFQYEELFWLVLAWNQADGAERLGDSWIVRVPGRTPWRPALLLAALALLALGAFYGHVLSVRDLAGRSLSVAHTKLGSAPSARPRLYFDETGLMRLRERARNIDAPEFVALRERADFLAGQAPGVCQTNDIRELARSIPPSVLAYRLFERASDLQQAHVRTLKLLERLDAAQFEDIEIAESLYALALAWDWLHEHWSEDRKSVV